MSGIFFIILNQYQMHMLKYIILIMLCFTFTACSSSTNAPVVKDPVWKNLHEGDPLLAGVEMSQCPEGAMGERAEAYIKGHPAMVLYYFWDGRVRQTGYEPNGEVIEDFYWNMPVGKRNAAWGHVDFSRGSDPTFIKNKDPRL